MEIILKILMGLLLFGSIFTITFIIREYRKFYKSPESEEGSAFEKFIIMLLAFSGVAFLVTVASFCLLIMFCELKIYLPW